MTEEVNKIKITEGDKKRYLLPKKRSFDILRKIKYLEKKRLNAKDKEVLKLIKTQLLKDWRKPLIVYLNKLIKKYG